MKTSIQAQEVRRTGLIRVLKSDEAANEPDCQCEACIPQGNPFAGGSMRMILCAICGNKRCPHATDHRNPCTNSNEPGQPGSSYENCVHAGDMTEADIRRLYETDNDRRALSMQMDRQDELSRICMGGGE